MGGELCLYVLGWSEFEWNQDYVLTNPDCPSEEQFLADIREVAAGIVKKMLRKFKGRYVGVDDVVKEIVVALEKKGYRRAEFKASAKLWSPSEGIFECLESEDNVKILGEEACRKIHEHNKKLLERGVW